MFKIQSQKLKYKKGQGKHGAVKKIIEVGSCAMKKYASSARSQLPFVPRPSRENVNIDIHWVVNYILTIGMKNARMHATQWKTAITDKVVVSTIELTKI